MDLINWVNDNIVWGVPALILFTGTGLYYSVRIKFFQIRKFPFILQNTLFAKSKDKTDGKNLTGIQTLTATLATTLGTGNIIAVGTAISAGGAGAVFWMWVSAVLGMATGYAENVLGVLYRKKNKNGSFSGGPFEYIKHGLNNPFLAGAFAVFCVLASFGMGNMAQINSISGAMKLCFNTPPAVTGISVAVMAGLVILGGVTRIGKVTEILTPVMAVIYTLGCIIVIGINIKSLPGAFCTIFSNAFSLRSAGGGFIGSAMLWGFRRGIFSNEAGLGSSVIMNCSGNTTAKQQGMWAMMQIFIDTVLICTLTAVCILVTGAHMQNLEGTYLAIYSFTSAFGEYAGAFVSISIFLFATATIIGWSHYGKTCAEFLLGERFVKAYLWIYIIMIPVGAVLSVEFIWGLSDMFNGLMAAPNLIAILALSKKVDCK